jgi:hypothetical protein
MFLGGREKARTKRNCGGLNREEETDTIKTVRNSLAPSRKYRTCGEFRLLELVTRFL